MAPRHTPTPEQLSVWREYLETAELIRNRISAQLQTDAGLSMGDYQVLLALKEADENQLRSSELASKIDWERSRMSHHLGRMEKRGLITRKECPHNGRSVLVTATTQGLNELRRSHPEHMRAIHEFFTSRLDAAQHTQLRAILKDLRPESGCAN